MTTFEFITDIMLFFAGVFFGIIVTCLTKINNGEHKNEEKDI